MRKKGRFCKRPFLLRYSSDCTGDLSRTQATGAGVNTLRGTVHHRLDTADVGLPGTVGTSVGVRNLNAEGNTLSAEITLSHMGCTSFTRKKSRKTSSSLKSTNSILADFRKEIKAFFHPGKKRGEKEGERGKTGKNSQTDGLLAGRGGPPSSCRRFRRGPRSAWPPVPRFFRFGSLRVFLELSRYLRDPAIPS